ncbi:acyl-homoserine-lactone synthase [Hyphococcus sp.]|uniref:acyl-homoserine-lactone synthase n=1 Tax=Hyphococcus sp. TaxID=2038636 RepID=UPI0035C6F69E
MLHLINASNAHKHEDLLRAMRRDRKRLFVDVFGWDLAHENGEERDSFDDNHADYLVLADAGGRHIASLRLLRTDRPHLLDTIFPELCDGPVPKGPDIREITRLCLPLRKRNRVCARNILTQAIIDYAAWAGIKRYTAVCHAAFLPELFSAGWRCAPLGAPENAGGGGAGAVEIAMDDNAKDLLVEEWRCGPSAPRLQLEPPAFAA